MNGHVYCLHPLKRVIFVLDSMVSLWQWSMNETRKARWRWEPKLHYNLVLCNYRCPILNTMCSFFFFIPYVFYVIEIARGQLSVAKKQKEKKSMLTWLFYPELYHHDFYMLCKNSCCFNVFLRWHNYIGLAAHFKWLFCCMFCAKFLDQQVYRMGRGDVVRNLNYTYTSEINLNSLSSCDGISHYHYSTRDQVKALTPLSESILLFSLFK